jgi:hypothetical protein
MKYLFGEVTIEECVSIYFVNKRGGERQRISKFMKREERMIQKKNSDVM